MLIVLVVQSPDNASVDLKKVLFYNDHIRKLGRVGILEEESCINAITVLPFNFMVHCSLKCRQSKIFVMEM